MVFITLPTLLSCALWCSAAQISNPQAVWGHEDNGAGRELIVAPGGSATEFILGGRGSHDAAFWISNRWVAHRSTYLPRMASPYFREGVSFLQAGEFMPSFGDELITIGREGLMQIYRLEDYALLGERQVNTPYDIDDACVDRATSFL